MPRRMRTHRMFYVGRIRPYCQYEPSSDDEDSLHVQESPSDSCARAPGDRSGRAVKRPLHSIERSLASCRLLFNKETDIPFDLKLCEGVISTILRTVILTKPCGASAQNRSERSVCPSRASNPRAIQRLRDPSRVGRDRESNDLEEEYPPPPHRLWTHTGVNASLWSVS